MVKTFHIAFGFPWLFESINAGNFAKNPTHMRKFI